MKKYLCILAVAAAMIAVPACSSTTAVLVTLTGQVWGGGAPIADAQVVVYQAGSTRRAGAVELSRSETNSSGFFEVSFQSPTDENTVIYVVATGPAETVGLASVLKLVLASTNVVINERTTVATAYAMAQFIDGATIGGTYPGVQNAAATVQNLVDITYGDLAAVLSGFPNGSFTSTMPTFNALANMLAACVADDTTCSTLFTAATTPGGSAPSNTLQAVINIAQNPAQNVADLFAYSQTDDTYTPAVDAAPDAWTLAIRYHGNGMELNGPGNQAIDADGNVWIVNNYT